jgi:DNA-binding helix-hairpin-helix protein with protein kinase domain
MQVQCLSNGQRLTLAPALTLGAGGEARIYTVPQHSSLVAKVYRTPDKVQARKLAVMIANPPDDPMGAHGHISIAWPVDLLSTVDAQRQVIGYFMPRVTGMRPLIACYNPSTRRQQWPLFNYRYLLRTAHNLAAAVRTLHARGGVIGDVNELYPPLQEMFTRCFETGHTRPLARPEAHAWQRALQEAEHALNACPANDQHLYGNHLRQRSLVPETLPVALRGAAPGVGWGAVWGAVWGTLWGLCRPPAVSGHRSRLGSALTGAVLGAALGMLTSTLIGITPSYTRLEPQNSFLEALPGVTRSGPLLTLPEVWRAFMAGLQRHALPWAAAGIALGLVRGAWRR